jgi:hypothetical protein
MLLPVAVAEQVSLSNSLFRDIAVDIAENGFKMDEVV